MPLNVYLNFQGKCREAIEFYADVFGDPNPQIMTYGEAPGDHPVPEGIKNWILHARMTVNGSPLMLSDVWPDHPFTVGNNISIALLSKSAEDLKNWFAKLKEGGTVHLELQETFWSKLYGSVTDKFGIHWQLNLDSEESGS
ncbi:VOC family protein [Staphylospora marina]|uniref:VOC family protein n=1 Tax=Staphylospora marina TaxID=2490858 RepID=UPI000F5B9E83|nr:VOC family protein [Staphylospora marina]